MAEIDIAELEKLNKLHFGWLFPDGSLVAVANLQHWSALSPELGQRYLHLVDEQRERDEAQINHEQEDAGDDYWPSYHRFDPEWDATVDLENEIYGKGYLRLGSYIQGKNNCLEVYGYKVGFDAHKDLIEFIYEALNCDRLYYLNRSNGKDKRSLIKKRR